MKLKVLFFTLLLLASTGSAEDLKKFISSDCNTLIGMDMKSLMAIPAVNAFLMASDSKEVKQMNELGLRPQDVNSVLIGLNSQALASDPLAFQQQPELISLSVVKEGITLEKLIKAAQENKVSAKEEEIDGIKSVLLEKDGKKFVMAQLTDNVIAVGSMKMVKKSIALKKSSSSDSISENKELIQLANAQKDIFWVVGSKPKAEVKSADEPLDNPANTLFSDLKMFTLSFTFADNSILFNSDLICNDKEGAERLAVTGQFLTAGLALNEDSPVKGDQIKFSTKESTLNIKIKIDSKSLIKTVEAAKGLAGE